MNIHDVAHEEVNSLLNKIDELARDGAWRELVELYDNAPMDLGATDRALLNAISIAVARAMARARGFDTEIMDDAWEEIVEIALEETTDSSTPRPRTFTLNPVGGIEITEGLGEIVELTYMEPLAVA